ncbi:hypothetical protein PQ455_01590 [Sphingomonas naphthae]|uniref:Uncharacterized protein n=1 Tax=Sphingomonas naphthae TaxID=1813468 RepID=A0ABY7TL36_9SPHN|nr:hypothetical protein [Sphingomonas naphthae]WCT73953.1 hypothetical protein PQ455_01590 [Sphingomonas naphthae]
MSDTIMIADAAAVGGDGAIVRGTADGVLIGQTNDPKWGGEDPAVAAGDEGGGHVSNLPGPGLRPDPFRLSCERRTHEGEKSWTKARSGHSRRLPSRMRLPTGNRERRSGHWRAWLSGGQTALDGLFALCNRLAISGALKPDDISAVFDFMEPDAGDPGAASVSKMLAARREEILEGLTE